MTRDYITTDRLIEAGCVSGEGLQDGEVRERGKARAGSHSGMDPGPVNLSIQSKHCSSWKRELITVLPRVLVESLR